MHLPRALGRGEGLKWPLGPLPRLGILAGAERHYGRHSLGLVLFIVSTGLNVSGQLYLHVAEKGHHLQLLKRKQTQHVRCDLQEGPGLPAPASRVVDFHVTWRQHLILFLMLLPGDPGTQRSLSHCIGPLLLQPTVYSRKLSPEWQSNLSKVSESVERTKQRTSGQPPSTDSSQKRPEQSWVWWLIPVISATQEVEIGRIMV
jgi:hypothetical protein